MIDSEKAITWRVTRYAAEIKPGDVAFISQTSRGLGGPGIRAAMEIQDEPAKMAEIASEIKYWVAAGQPVVECRVKGQLTHRCKVLTFNVLRGTPGLASLSIYSRERATNFAITKAEGEIIMRLLSQQLPIQHLKRYAKSNKVP